MGTYNLLHTTASCPRCGTTGPVVVEFAFGLLDLRDYGLGDRIEWGTKGLRSPSRRPPGGDHDGEGYAECPRCGKDYWVRITVRNDAITAVQIDPGRPGHIP